MAVKNEIDSKKILIRGVFEMWFRIPEYQRPYVWGNDQINDLLDDITYAMTERPDSQYFLGTFVFQKRAIGSSPEQNFEENDLMDGQQRLTTLLLLFAVLRDMSNNPKIKETCQGCVFQEGNEFTQKPERIRLTFEHGVRESSCDFIDKFVKPMGGTASATKISEFVKNTDGISIRNMAKAIEIIRAFWASDNAPDMGKFLGFLLNNVLMIYVATENLDDAFRLFTILNNRGVQLRNSDILKSMNLGALTDEDEKIKYAKIWEDAENGLGDDFDRFLNYLRTILVKEKARLSLLNEFEDKIYSPKERDKSTGQPKPQLLKKGKDTFEMVKEYLEIHSAIFSGDHKAQFGDYRFDNLLKVMNYSLPSSDWVPPLLFYYHKYQTVSLPDFLHKLNIKFAADWICQFSPTDRINHMNDVLRAIENSSDCSEVINANIFDFDEESFIRSLNGNIYGRRFALYVVLMVDYFLADHAHRMIFEKLSIEHILPQNPDPNSKWCSDFSDEDRKNWTDKIGNLVLITGNKNSSQGRLDYVEKKRRYFANRITCCPNSLHVLEAYSSWTLEDLQKNHEDVLGKLKSYFFVK